MAAKKIEERIWKEVVGIIEGVHRHRLYEALQDLENKSQGKSSFQYKEAEKIAVEAKIATLARRVASLPEGVPADAFFDEMRKLNDIKVRIDLELTALRQKNLTQKVVTPTQYEKLLGMLKATLQKPNETKEIPSDTKRRIIQALIQEIRVTSKGFKLHFFAGLEQIKTGEALASPASSLKKKISVPSSFLQLNGGGFGRLVEPLVVAEKHLLQWVRPKIDLVELAKLRRAGWTISRLADHFGKPRSTICRKLKPLKETPHDSAIR